MCVYIYMTVSLIIINTINILLIQGYLPKHRNNSSIPTNIE